MVKNTFKYQNMSANKKEGSTNELISSIMSLSNMINKDDLAEAIKGGLNQIVDNLFGLTCKSSSSEDDWKRESYMELGDTRFQIDKMTLSSVPDLVKFNISSNNKVISTIGPNVFVSANLVRYNKGFYMISSTRTENYLYSMNPVTGVPSLVDIPEGIDSIRTISSRGSYNLIIYKSKKKKGNSYYHIMGGDKTKTLHLKNVSESLGKVISIDETGAEPSITFNTNEKLIELPLELFTKEDLSGERITGVSLVDYILRVCTGRRSLTCVRYFNLKEFRSSVNSNLFSLTTEIILSSDKFSDNKLKVLMPHHMVDMNIVVSKNDESLVGMVQYPLVGGDKYLVCSFNRVSSVYDAKPILELLDPGSMINEILPINGCSEKLLVVIYSKIEESLAGDVRGNILLLSLDTKKHKLIKKNIVPAKEYNPYYVHTYSLEDGSWKVRVLTHNYLIKGSSFDKISVKRLKDQ